jgi:hypothetical protein
MIPNELMAAWVVAATTGLAALGGLSLLDSRSSPSGLEAEPLPFHYPDISTALRLPPPDNAWRSRLEATGSLPARPAATPAEWGDDDVDEMDQRDRKDERSADPLATVYDPKVFLGP